MSNISKILDDLEHRGHRITVAADGRLAVENAKALTETDRERIRQRKGAIVSWLSPQTSLGPEAAADAVLLSGLIDSDPEISRDALAGLALGLGITGDRWPAALVSLPERLNQKR